MPLNIGILAAFAAMICWGFGDFFIQRATRRIGSVESLFFIGLTGSIFLLPFVWNDIPALLSSTSDLLLLLFLGILTFIVAMFNFEGLKVGKLSVIDVLLEIELPITVVLGVALLGESLSLLQIGFIGLIFGGSLLIAANSLSWPHLSSTLKKGHQSIWHSFHSFSLSHWSLSLEKGVAFAVLGAFGMGILNFLTGVAAKGISPIMAIWAPSVIFAFISFAIILSREGFGALWSNAVRYKELVAAESVFDTAAWVFFAIALYYGSISITTAITESYPAIALTLGLWFNKEKIAHHQFAGAGLALLSSVALGFWV